MTEVTDESMSLFEKEMGMRDFSDYPFERRVRHKVLKKLKCIEMKDHETEATKRRLFEFILRQPSSFFSIHFVEMKQPLMILLKTFTEMENRERPTSSFGMFR